MSFAAI